MKVLHTYGLRGLLVDYHNNYIKYYDDIDNYEIHADITVCLRSNLELDGLIIQFKNLQYKVR